MPKLKAYTLGNHGFVPPAVLAAIGEPAHIRQASVLIIAATKREAVEIAAARGIRAELSSEEFRVASGPLAEQLVRFADSSPMVFVSPMTGSPSNVVVGLGEGGQPWPVGRVVREAGAVTFQPWES